MNAPRFEDLTDACRAVLLTAAQVLHGSGIGFVIAGGWAPVLLGRGHSFLRHPGTRDVDVLLTGDRDAATVAAKALLDASFRPSAKHEFQLLRDARVYQTDRARETDFVFNVDLMHPFETSRSPTEFEDIFDLGVPDSYDPRGSRFMKSIAFTSAAIVTEQKLFEKVPVSGVDLDGTSVDVNVPILNLAAFVLSKAQSVSVKKRTRDAFDIYYVLTGPRGPEAANGLRTLATRFPDVQEQLRLLESFLEQNDRQFDGNVARHQSVSGRSPAAETRSILFGEG